MNKQPFNHSEQSRKQLTERGNELWRNLNDIDYPKPRREQIKHELSCIAFEQLYRDGKLNMIKGRKNQAKEDDDEAQDD